MIYDVIRKSDGEKVYEYQSDTRIAWDDMGFSEYDHVGRPYVPEGGITPPLTKFDGRRLLTKLEFRSLFPESAIKAIDRFEAQFEQSTFLTDDQKDNTRTSFNDYHEAENVNLDDPRWVPGLGLYVALGMISEQEVSEVLRG